MKKKITFVSTFCGIMGVSLEMEKAFRFVFLQKTRNFHKKISHVLATCFLSKSLAMNFFPNWFYSEGQERVKVGQMSKQ